MGLLTDSEQVVSHRAAETSCLFHALRKALQIRDVLDAHHCADIDIYSTAVRNVNDFLGMNTSIHSHLRRVQNSQLRVALRFL